MDQLSQCPSAGKLPHDRSRPPTPPLAGFIFLHSSYHSLMFKHWCVCFFEVGRISPTEHKLHENKSLFLFISIFPVPTTTLGI